MPREPRKLKPKHATYEGGDERTLKRIPTPPKHWAWNPPPKKSRAKPVKVEPKYYDSKALAHMIAEAHAGVDKSWLITWDHPIRGQQTTERDWLILLQALLNVSSNTFTEVLHLVQYSKQHRLLAIEELNIDIQWT